MASLAAALVSPAPAAAGGQAATGTDKMRAAEARLLRNINRVRVHNGRRRLRLDRRTSRVARARSRDMAARRYFGHVEPDGDDAGRILRRRGIRAASVSENIGQTLGLSLREGSSRMATWWYRSRPHRVQMLARDINYVGLGIARRGSRFTYTAIFTRSRDRTPPRVAIDGTRLSRDGSRVTIDWRGGDPRLSAGNDGIRRFDIERLILPGGWERVEVGPRRSRRSFSTIGWRDQHFRIRAVDKAGNVSDWAYARIDVPGARPRVV